MRKSIWTIVALGVIALALSACSGDSEGDTSTPSSTGADPTTTSAPADTTTVGESGDASITIDNFAFSGATTVAAGTTVTVTNQDGVTHTWTSQDDVWNSGGMSTGESFEFTFEEPGEYPYLCTIHPTMEGTITVEG